jgi:hypothetical protein
MAAMWQVVSEGRSIGTYPETDLVRWVGEGRINPADLFWRAGMPAAAPAHTIAPFAGTFSSPIRPADSSLRWILPVGRSGWAIAAGYLGLLSILLVPGPLAVVTGLLGLRDIRRHPGRLGTGRAVFGIVSGVLASALLLHLLS